ncbi:HAD hydrolase family protein [uncultured Thomasclavelia sp.]|uniref:HAD hydrolase family protein n=1 Tax=uncultured Thomasclavelia sp. TaxID=3025759 RepID=UPI0025E2A8F5|nr:HAD hydrolase family protein [uncultured Thomasclavelia sp.]
MKKIPLPGLRIIKSSVAVILCFVIYVIRGETGTPFYSAIAALWCMRPFVANSYQMARQRILGTFIGAIYGLLVVAMKIYLGLFNEVTYYFISAVLIIAVLYTTILINKKEASYFSCVVFLSITINHITDVNPLIFVFNRVLDTIIGIVVAVLVNRFRIPYHKRNDILFISGLDETLLTISETLTPYSQIELKRMLDDGIKFTVSSLRTPASIMEVLGGIKLNLPVIAMDGAVLYNINENHFEYVIAIKPQTAKQLKSFLMQYEVNYFSNEIIDDRLIIYYGDFKNEAELNIYQQLKKNPYRNYIKQHSNNNDNVVYIMLIDHQEIIDQIEMALKKEFDDLKILKYPSTDYPGYYYLKIYDINATRANMNEYLKQQINASKIVTFGSIPGKYDVLIAKDDSNKVVRTLKRMYEPYFFEK